MPFVINDVSASPAPFVDLGARPVHVDVVGRGRRGELDEVAGEPHVALVGECRGPARQASRPTRERRQLGRQL